MIDGLLIAMVIVALWQPTLARAQAAIAFSFITAAHAILFTDVPGFWYYLIAASADLLIINTLALLPYPTLLTVRLMHISVISMLLNAVGWVFYMLYLPPFGYDLLFIGVYTVGIAAMLGKEGADVGDNTVDSRRPGVRGIGGSGRLHS